MRTCRPEGIIRGMRLFGHSSFPAGALRFHWLFFAAWAVILGIRIMGLDPPQGVMIFLGAVILITASVRVFSMSVGALRKSLNERRDIR